MHCGGALEHKEYRDRSVIDSQPLRAEPILYQLERARCRRCGKTVQARAPEVLPKSLYGNQLITQVVFLHYRQAPVRHADETGWRTDGRSGYAWLFASATVSLFLFRATRSAQAPREVLGTQTLDGVLVVDRYNAYNQSPCALQYCSRICLGTWRSWPRSFPAKPR